MQNYFTPSSAFQKALAGGALLLSLATAPAVAQTAYGVGTNGSSALSLFTFDVTNSSVFTATAVITGVTAGQTLVGLDSRPATGELFALGYNPTGTQAQLYILNKTTGAATTVGPALPLNLGATTTRIGFDFNPTLDRIRVTSGARTNFRLNPNNGALVATDGPLTYAATDANASQTPEVGSSAYTNSYIGSTATTLYNLDEGNNRLVTQLPPNDGTLNTAATLAVATNFATKVADIDIYFNAATRANVAYFSTAGPTPIGNNSILYTLDLATGATTFVGPIGPSYATYITDIALASTRPATLPPITGNLAYALAGTNLLTFDTALPGTIRTSVGITGVDVSQMLVGLDVRPLNNGLYVLGYNAATATGVVNTQLYSLNAVTGVATALGAAFRLELGTGNIGFDFNPTVDRIRVVGANGNNYRLNPLTGGLAATDGVVTYSAGTATPTIGAVAYTNSFSGSTATTLYNYDQVLNYLNTQATANPPADGQLTTVGPSGLTVNAAAPVLDLDIYSPAAGTNTAYLVANTGTSANTSLYTVNLANGAATLVGAIGNGLSARNIAVAAATGVVTGTRAAELATDLYLSPNPSVGGISLLFKLVRPARVEVVITDLLGRPVDTRDAGVLAAGAQTVRWAREGQAAGLYFFRLRLDGQFVGTRRALLTE